MKNFIGMGDYCTTANGELMKIVCQGKEAGTNRNIIGYVTVGAGGIAGDLTFMEEKDFKKNLVSHCTMLF